jgi:hypothetical protein
MAQKTETYGIAGARGVAQNVLSYPNHRGGYDEIQVRVSSSAAVHGLSIHVRYLSVDLKTKASTRDRTEQIWSDGSLVGSHRCAERSSLRSIASNLREKHQNFLDGIPRYFAGRSVGPWEAGLASQAPQTSRPSMMIDVA